MEEQSCSVYKPNSDDPGARTLLRAESFLPTERYGVKRQQESLTTLYLCESGLDCEQLPILLYLFRCPAIWIATNYF